MKPRHPALAAASCADRNAVWFELLRARLLLAWLETVPRSELHIRLFRAADESAMLALQSGFPLLVLPELFAEKARAALPPALIPKPAMDEVVA